MLNDDDTFSQYVAVIEPKHGHVALAVDAVEVGAAV
jgi:hypothetical protein